LSNSLNKIIENPQKKNVRTIVALEEKALHNRSLVNRASDAITHFSGTIAFVILHALWFTLWIAANLGWIPHVVAFDPYPFNFLTLIVSLEAIFLSTFVLMSQNQMSYQADRRSQLDLQINLLAEQETTAILQLLQRICRHLGVDSETSEKINQFTKETDIPTLVNELAKKLPT
jgi:uncharacterized membrane protein